MENFSNNVPTSNQPPFSSPEPAAPAAPSAATQSPSGSLGPLIGSVVVIIILVIGAIYFWGSKLTPKSEPIEQPAAALSVSDSDEALQSDLNNTPDVNIDTNF